MWVLDQSRVTGRDNLGTILPKTPKSKGVEVGTHRGVFADKLLSTWPGTLYCVDPYLSGYDDRDPASRGDRKADKEQAMKVLGKYKGRMFLLEEVSIRASQRFVDGELDFVYVDGKHREESVRKDLNFWWPKVKRRGFVGGHDIICPHEDGGGWGREVQPAVLDFAKEHNIPVKLIVELDGWPWSYILEKP